MYKGDPDLFHAKYIVAVARGGELQEELLFSFSRAANSAKKQLLVACADGNSKETEYLVISHSRDLN